MPPTLEIVTVLVTPFQQNCRVLISPGDRVACVVDPGGDGDRILEMVRERGVELSMVWLTHSHLDHCGGVRKIVNATGAKLYGHPREQHFRANVETLCRVYGIPPGDMENSPEPTIALTGGERIVLGECSAEVRFTPGHSPGHLCFYFGSEGILLAGDTLFAGSIGRTDLPEGNHAQLLESIRREIYTLPDTTRVLPGHGPDTTVGEEKENNPYVMG